MREEEKKQPSPMKPSLKRVLRKRWVFPAVYLTSAAVILAGVLWFQSNHDEQSQKDEYEYSQDAPGTSYNENDSIPVNESVEHISMPVLDPNAVEVKTPFYDYAASKEEQEAALVFYNNTYYPNHGIDLVMKDGKEFEVTASLSGTVTTAKKDPILGYVVEIDHDNGVVTVYQSLADLQVKEGDTVKQGEVIGKAGQSQFNQEAGTHVHFEIRKDGKTVNPLDYVDKPVTSLTESNAAEQNDKQQTENQSENNQLNNQSQSDQQNNQAPSEQNQSEQSQSNDQSTTDENSTNQDSSYKTPDSSIGMART
ncbi:stage II sporulation protein Q [Anoxybacillus sp. B7M1]|jgi:stage II sporulation protein Q|uniref:M23 family metallopeptidase n=1 Tax=Anoxybacteroides rupiense TaxID=311460 RepID=A0ABD5IWU1_9BACL|nr:MULTISPECIES: M23 family metallopeptidase [Anoxybacillus]ANB56943.1 stage II sporulation protein Q [Anoxybacillus sp. B2M1]ANB65488.1 stage II sporulation protein Q [Anoxybacillus sp. B7M1]KXG08484.1 Stage II sporulation protein Q [Anoxybacillus sp. P3H1B]MBB3908333.1 stage II sporulation protein Q [Anoxybacillus rupiensis]MDE8564748.1 M23 family metallopeptidase [Anoxybacillus rupiensis]